MAHTQRLTVVEQDKPLGLLERFTKKRAPSPPDEVLIGQMKIRAADTCIEHIRQTFTSIHDQVDVLELMETVFKDAERRMRAYGEAQE
jgi:hypothetical protein